MFKYRHIAFIFVLLWLSTSALASGIAIDNAWIREAPPVSRIQAGYVKISNNDSSDVVLLSATSPTFKKIEFHQTVLENGLSKMQPLSEINISNNSHVMLEPEGMHMMLFNPAKTLRAGDKISITFSFNNGKKTTTNFIVKRTVGHNVHQHMHH